VANIVMFVAMALSLVLKHVILIHGSELLAMLVDLRLKVVTLLFNLVTELVEAEIMMEQAVL
jgi:hypothetical protein